MNKEPQESTGFQAVPAINPTLDPPIYHKLDGFASSIEHSTPLLELIREAQYVISSLGQKLIDTERTNFLHECKIEMLGRDVSELQKQLAMRQEPQAESEVFRLPYLTLEETTKLFVDCGFNFGGGTLPSAPSIKVATFLKANSHVKYIHIAYLPATALGLNVVFRELTKVTKHRTSTGHFVVNPFFDPLCEDRVNQLKPEPQSDPGDEQPEMEPLDVINQFAKAACNIAEVPTDEGTYKDWLCSLIDKILELQSQTKGDTGAKEEPC
jgi:hypothetical protein